MQTDMSSEPALKVILIHGVGNPAVSELIDSTRKEFEAAGIASSCVYEFNWNSSVRHPFAAHEGDADRSQKTRWQNGAYIAQLGDSVLNAALIPFDDGGSPWAKSIVLLLEHLALLAQALPSLVFILPVSYFLRIPTLFRITLTVAIAMCVMTIIAGAVARRFAILFQGLRAVLLPLLWSLIYLILVPANTNWKIVSGLLSAATVLWATFNHLPDWAPLVRWVGSGDLGGYVLNWPFALLMVPVSFLAGFLSHICYRSVRAALFLPLKISADVAHYLGNRNYRGQILRALTAMLVQAGTVETKLVFVTHSLGSIIAIDYLREVKALNCAEVTLITAGSPLKRLFCRFFSSRYPAVHLIEGEFAAKFRNFQWVNVFRPFDPIGGRLGLSPERDVNTRQYNRLFMSAHSDYWSDRIPHAIVSQCLRASRLETSNKRYASTSEKRSGLIFEKQAHTLRRWCAGLVCLAVLSPLYAIVIKSRLRESRREYFNLLTTSHLDAAGRVAHWEQAFDDTPPQDEWRITYTPIGVAGPESVDIFVFDLIDYSELATAFEKHHYSCQYDKHPAECMDVTVSYLPSSPQICTLKDYMVHSYDYDQWTMGDVVAMSVYYTILLGMMTAATIIWFRLIGATFLSSLFGLEWG